MVSEVEMRDEVQMIPISAITVENPRERSEKTFRALVDSIGKVGLKKPITVARVDEEAGVSYRLVCIDPAESAQVKPLMRMPQRGFSCPAPDVGVGCCRS